MAKKSVFQLITHGTRGTQSVAGPEYKKFGGRTTCVEIQSEKLPLGELLFIDAGTGLLSGIKSHIDKIVSGEIKTIRILNTHHHKDHIEGFLTYMLSYRSPLSTQTYCYGPKPPSGHTHKKAVLSMFDGDTWPIEKGLLSPNLHFITLDHFPSQIFIIHPRGGFELTDFQHLESSLKKGQFNFSSSVYDLDESLVIKMQPTNHGNSVCASFRIEDRGAEKVAVFCTDHEAHSAPPQDIKTHFKDADVLISDCTYTTKQTVSLTSGWGHGTPMGVMREALAGLVKSLYLTHHDPLSTDEKIQGEIWKEVEKAYQWYTNKSVFLDTQKIDTPTFTMNEVFNCRDGMVIDVLTGKPVSS